MAALLGNIGPTGGLITLMQVCQGHPVGITWARFPRGERGYVLKSLLARQPSKGKSSKAWLLACGAGALPGTALASSSPMASRHAAPQQSHFGELSSHFHKSKV